MAEDLYKLAIKRGYDSARGKLLNDGTRVAFARTIVPDEVELSAYFTSEKVYHNMLIITINEIFI